ncbi:hypothetical protein HDV02_004768 [Globomyces sp. JEL0801]|nr:hypothetical protein HDV02_004768 [Globomyces sp. JEL0801]
MVKKADKEVKVAVRSSSRVTNSKPVYTEVVVKKARKVAPKKAKKDQDDDDDEDDEDHKEVKTSKKKTKKATDSEE